MDKDDVLNRVDQYNDLTTRIHEVAKAIKKGEKEKRKYGEWKIKKPYKKDYYVVVVKYSRMTGFGFREIEKLTFPLHVLWDDEKVYSVDIV